MQVSYHDVPTTVILEPYCHTGMSAAAALCAQVHFVGCYPHPHKRQPVRSQFAVLLRVSQLALEARSLSADCCCTAVGSANGTMAVEHLSQRGQRLREHLQALCDSGIEFAGDAVVKKLKEMFCSGSFPGAGAFEEAFVSDPECGQVFDEILAMLSQCHSETALEGRHDIISVLQIVFGRCCDCFAHEKQDLRTELMSMCGGPDLRRALELLAQQKVWEPMSVAQVDKKWVKQMHALYEVAGEDLWKRVDDALGAEFAASLRSVAGMAYEACECYLQHRTVEGLQTTIPLHDVHVLMRVVRIAVCAVSLLT